MSKSQLNYTGAQFPQKGFASVGTPLRVMRWTYASRDARCSCDVSLDSSHMLYAFRISWADSHRVSLEHYQHVTQVFERQSQFEADLLSAGFSLEEFTTTETPAAPMLRSATVH